MGGVYSSGISHTADAAARQATDLPTGVSIDNVRSQWYVLRATYGRERRAADYLQSCGIDTYCPTHTIVRIIGGHRREVEEPLLPNIFFAYASEDTLKTYVYDNVNLSYLRFYYRYTGSRGNVARVPLIVPDRQIKALRLITSAAEDNIILTTEEIAKFRLGRPVRILRGSFAGLIGRVARYQGQQRVGITIPGLLTAATAYIPTAFLEALEEKVD